MHTYILFGNCAESNLDLVYEGFQDHLDTNDQTRMEILGPRRLLLQYRQQQQQVVEITIPLFLLSAPKLREKLLACLYK